MFDWQIKIRSGAKYQLSKWSNCFCNCREIMREVANTFHLKDQLRDKRYLLGWENSRKNSRAIHESFTDASMHVPSKPRSTKDSFLHTWYIAISAWSLKCRAASITRNNALILKWRSEARFNAPSWLQRRSERSGKQILNTKFGSWFARLFCQTFLP